MSLSWPLYSLEHALGVLSATNFDTWWVDQAKQSVLSSPSDWRLTAAWLEDSRSRAYISLFVFSAIVFVFMVYVHMTARVTRSLLRVRVGNDANSRDPSALRMLA